MTDSERGNGCESPFLFCSDFCKIIQLAHKMLFVLLKTFVNSCLMIICYILLLKKLIMKKKFP